MNNALDKILRLQELAGSNEKLAYIKTNKDDEDFCRYLYYACHPRMTYKVSEASLSTPGPHPCNFVFENFYEVCDVLASKKAVSDEMLHSVIYFLEEQKAWEREVYVQILAKTLRLGVTSKTINKAIPGLFPEWSVQQAYPVEKYPLKEGAWFALTQKLNGVRCTYYRGQLIARSGDLFTGLDHIANELSRWPDMVFDGELTLKDKGDLSDNEAFRVATGIINSDEEDKSRICFTIFDMLPADQFDKGESGKTYRHRREQLNQMHGVFCGSKHVFILPTLYQGCDQSKIDELLDQMVVEDKEGLMVNLDVLYKCKRHSGILKVKRFYTMDLPICGFEEGTGKFAGTLGALFVGFKGNQVGVGTGFSDAQRADFWNRRDELMGELVEVKYKEISSDKKTKAESLQFPVFVRLRTDKQDISYG